MLDLPRASGQATSLWNQTRFPNARDSGRPLVEILPVRRLNDGLNIVST